MMKLTDAIDFVSVTTVEEMFIINWLFYPKNKELDECSKSIIHVFEDKADKIDSLNNDFNSNKVLSIVSDELSKLGFKVETSKKSEDKVHVPVLFGLNGKIEKAFDADAYLKETKYIVEVEAGRAVVN